MIGVCVLQVVIYRHGTTKVAVPCIRCSMRFLISNSLSLLLATQSPLIHANTHTSCALPSCQDDTKHKSIVAGAERWSRTTITNNLNTQNTAVHAYKHIVQYELYTTVWHGFCFPNGREIVAGDGWN